MPSDTYDDLTNSIETETFYKAEKDGYLAIRITGTVDTRLHIAVSKTNSLSGIYYYDSRPLLASQSVASCIVPIRKNCYYLISAFTGSIVYARFIYAKQN